MNRPVIACPVCGRQVALTLRALMRRHRRHDGLGDTSTCTTSGVPAWELWRLAPDAPASA